MQLVGELAKINLASLIQLVRNGELTGKICLTRGVNTAFLYADHGRLVHAETDVSEGKEALMELFLWTTGTFSYLDCSLADVPVTISAEESTDKILHNGISYSEAKKFLDQLRISTRTVLKAIVANSDDPILSRLDGSKRLEELIPESGLRYFEYLIRLQEIMRNGQAVVVENEPVNGQIVLPDWVVSRLKQDNPDVSQAVVQLVIWADRLKCWMYQTDADLEKIISTLAAVPQDTVAQDSEV